MITLRILLSPGRRGRIVDASGRSVPQPLPAPVIGSAEPLRIILLDPATLDPADPYGFDTGAPLRLTISGDWDPATIPVYATNALERTGVGTYDLADPSGTRTAEALALLGVLAERLCAWELTAYGGDPATEADWAHPLSVVQFDAPLRQRADSLGGDPAEAPAVDLRGPAGKDGASATVSVGTTTTLPPGSSATVENVGTPSNVVLNFGIPGAGLPSDEVNSPDPTQTSSGRCWIPAIGGKLVYVWAPAEKYSAFNEFIVGFYNNTGIGEISRICLSNETGSSEVTLTIHYSYRLAKTILVPPNATVLVTMWVVSETYCVVLAAPLMQ